MSDEEQFAEWTRRSTTDYNRLPDPTPEARDAMWARIQGSVSETVASYERSAPGDPAGRALGFRRSSAGSSRAPSAESRRAWPAWVSGIAAALVIGVGIGRVTAPATTTVVVRDGGATSVEAPALVRNEAPASVVDHLARSAVFLASFREDARSGQMGSDVRERGRDLLSATQILMDSPASQDPRMRLLLEDLELVLAQIAQVNGRRGAEEARIATDAMRQRDILPRLRTVVPEEALDASASASAGND